MKHCFLFLAVFLPLLAFAQSPAAEVCELQTSNSAVRDIATYGRQEEAFKMAKTCAAGAGAGVWSATGGKAEGGVEMIKGAAAFVKSPVASMSKMADSLKQTYGAIGEIYNQGWSFFSTLPAPMVTEMMCSMGSAIATESLITLLTGGANSVNMAARVLKYVDALKIIAQLKALAQKLGLSLQELLKTMQSLDAKARAKMNDLLSSKEGRGRVESLLTTCTR